MDPGLVPVVQLNGGSAIYGLGHGERLCENGSWAQPQLEDLDGAVEAQVRSKWVCS